MPVGTGYFTQRLTLILKRYLYKETLQNFLAVFLILLLIVFSLRFVRYLGDVAAGKMTAEIIYQMLILRMITSLTVIVPLCLYLAIFLSMGRMQRDNELIALADAGLGQRFYLKTFLLISGGVAVLLLLLTLFIMPWAEHNVDVLKQKANREADITGITSGSFKDFNRGNRVLYVEEFLRKSGEMRNVFLQVFEQGSSGVLTSDLARIETDANTGQRSVIFENGKRYVGHPGKLDYSITEYERYAVKLEQEGYKRDSQSLAKTPSINLLQSAESTSKTELWWRFSTPLAVLLLSVLAVLIVHRSRDVRGSLFLVGAILVYFIYNNLLNIFHDMLMRDKVSQWVGLLTPHLILVVIIACLIVIPRWRNRRLAT